MERQLVRRHHEEETVRSYCPIQMVPDPGAAWRRATRQRFLGEEISSDPLSDGRWLVKAVLGRASPLEITRDGVIPTRPSRVLPLRHGLTGAELPATCLLDAPGLARLRVGSVGTDADVECAACRAWQATHGISPQRSSPPVMARIRAALGEVFTKAA